MDLGSLMKREKPPEGLFSCYRCITSWLFSYGRGIIMKTSQGVDFTNQSLFPDMKMLHMVAFVLLVVGGLNWLLVAFGYNLVDMIFGMGSQISMIIYILVGLSAIYEVISHKKTCKMCSGGMM